MEKIMENSLKTRHPDDKGSKKFIKSVPMAMSGLALGLSALGNLFFSDKSIKSEALRDTLRLSCGFLALIVLTIFLIKVFRDFAHAREELKTSIPASVLLCTTMAIMLLCAYLKTPLTNTPTAKAYVKIMGTLSVVSSAIWFTTVVAHVAMMVFFFRRFVAGIKIDTVFPSWFIAFVGLVVASVTAPAMNVVEVGGAIKINALIIGQACFYVGFVLYFICLFLVLKRMIKIPHKFFPVPARPTIVIFTAPMSLLIVGYFNSFNNAGIALNNSLLYIMFAIALASYVFALIMMIPALIKRFHPSFSSFTFPLVISALAFRLCATYIVTIKDSFKFLVHFANVTQWIAAAAVLYVVIGYIRYFIYWVKF